MARQGQPELITDPVAAYERIAPWFRAISDRRRAYLDAIDTLITERIPAGSVSLLDVGSGTGERARRIAERGGLTEITLLEPSCAMRSGGGAGEVLDLRAEQLHLLPGRYDVITCLWNVLGHIFPRSRRVEVLRQFARLTPTGPVFIDLNHRYNAREYGFWMTAGRYFRDWTRSGESRGDVMVRWSAGDAECQTLGHVFTDGEFRRMCREAGLTVEARIVVNYRNGSPSYWSWAGNLLYVLCARTI